MGNEISSHEQETNRDHQKHSKLSKFLKSKLKKTNKKKIHIDDFIIKHTQNNKNNDNNIDINSFNQKRVVFLSVICLYRTWKKVPSHILYSCLLLMPLKKKWIYQPSKYQDELRSSFISEIIELSNIAEMEQFIEMLKWKDSQCLVIWILDDHKYPKHYQFQPDQLIDPFWYHLSTKLTTLYDPISRSKYKPLKLDKTWWQNNKLFKSKYNTKTVHILSELYFLGLKYNTMQEIIYQSNPDSLCPMISYNDITETIINIITPITHRELCQLSPSSPLSPISPETHDVDIYDNDEKEEWYISDCYNPYEMDSDNE